VLTLGAEHLRSIEIAAQAAFPEEACGLLVGHTENVDDIILSAVIGSDNVAPDARERRFEVDPGVRIKLEKDLRGGTERLVGHYHSHPDGPARPSAHDLEQAFEPDLIWLVVGVADGHANEVRAWKLAPGGAAFEPVALTVAALRKAQDT